MTAFRFRDLNGFEGRISESLEVDYAGEWQEEVCEELRRIESDGEDDPEESTPVDSRIVLELPEEAPVVEVERLDDPMTSTRQQR